MYPIKLVQKSSTGYGSKREMDPDSKNSTVGIERLDRTRFKDEIESVELVGKKPGRHAMGFTMILLERKERVGFRTHIST